MKDNALYEVVEAKKIPQNRNILKDEVIRLTGITANQSCPHLLRRIEAYDPETDRMFVFLTNHMELGALPSVPCIKTDGRLNCFSRR